MKIKVLNLIILLTFLLGMKKAMAQDSLSIKNSRYLFEKNCARCHGKDGTKGKFGAKNLQTSKMTDAELINIISNGKKRMPAWEGKLASEQIIVIIEYIKTLRE